MAGEHFRSRLVMARALTAKTEAACHLLTLKDRNGL